MTVIKALFGWFLRQGLVLCLIVVAIAFHQFIWPMVSDGTIKSAVGQEMMSPIDVGANVNRLKKQSLDEFEVSKRDIFNMTSRQLTVTLKKRRADLFRVKQDVKELEDLFASLRPTVLIKREALKLEQKTLSAEINLLEQALDRRQLEFKVKSTNYPMRFPTKNAVKDAWERCDSANKNSEGFNRRTDTEKRLSNLVHGSAGVLSAAVKKQCAEYRTVRDKRKSGLEGEAAREKLRKAKATLQQAGLDASKNLDGHVSDIGSQTIWDLLKKALVILAGIIAMPFIIRTIFYYVLAPFAEGRTSIRMKGLDGGGATIPLTANSRISIGITLAQGEELLVRQNYLQTSSLTGKKSTRWLLDYRHVLSSIASGLSFLTRVRGEGEITTVSAVHDNMAELNEVTLPNGSACVLHPRALVAVVQPMGKTMKISSHWRLFSLNAWLTFQLRYLVFHGPVRLIIKGGRGIRIERAERGRIFGQDQLVGFSTDIAYSVVRTETFAPYFFGRQQLFKDKVESGSGIVIIEEAPFSLRQGGGVRRGLEGMLDAGMKAFGL